MTQDALNDFAVPPHVLRALERLETARSPADLGPDYGVLLHWQPTPAKLRFKLRRPNFIVLPGILASAVFIALDSTSEWQKGFFTAAGFMLIVAFLQPLFDAQVTQRKAFRRRVQLALDKWRHLVPAMRELPQ